MPQVDNLKLSVAIDDESAEIGCAEDLAITLDVLNGRRDGALLEQLRPLFKAIAENAADLAILMRSHEKNDQLLLVEHFAGALPDILRNAGRLRKLLAFASSFSRDPE